MMDDAASDHASSSNAAAVSLRTLVDAGEKLGSGAFSEVFLYRSRARGNDVYAVKRMKQSRLIAAGMVERVFHERDTLLQCGKGPGSRFIARLFAVERNRTYLYLIMECAEGGDLNKHMQLEEGQKFNEVRSRFYAAELALALRHLHCLGIIHRDLKANNVALSKDGHVKLLDFGSAKFLYKKNHSGSICEKTTRMIRTSTRLGCSHMSAPEIARGESHSTGVDWWALGVLTYEMLFGQPPFPYVFEQTEASDQTLRRAISMGLFDLSEKTLKRADLASARPVDFIRALLHIDEVSRLGFSGSSEVLEHEWFKEHAAASSEEDDFPMPSIDWDALEQGDEDAPGFNAGVSLVFKHVQSTAKEDFDATMRSFEDF